jgi:hypothetical protein
MIALLGLFIIITLSLIVVRIGAAILELTGLSSEAAGFQAQSAFTGVGFTTVEAENVVNHPFRRKIIRYLMLLGNIGLTSSMASLILTFVGQQGTMLLERLILLLVGLVIFFIMVRSDLLYKVMKKSIVKALQNLDDINVYDYQELLGISHGYIISEVKVKAGSWLDGKRVRDLRLDREGTLILGIKNPKAPKSKASFGGVPKADDIIQAGNIIVLYGRKSNCKSLSCRMKGFQGDKEHSTIVKLEKEFDDIQSIA